MREESFTLRFRVLKAYPPIPLVLMRTARSLSLTMPVLRKETVAVATIIIAVAARRKAKRTLQQRQFLRQPTVAKAKRYFASIKNESQHAKTCWLLLLKESFFL